MAVNERAQRALLTTIDAVAGSASAVVVVLLAIGEPVGGSEPTLVAGLRAVAALVFVCFCPGWVVIRLGGFGLHSMTLVGAFVVSVTIAILTSFLLATAIGWEWRAAGIGLAAVTTVGAAILLVRSSISVREVDGAAR